MALMHGRSLSFVEHDVSGQSVLSPSDTLIRVLVLNCLCVLAFIVVAVVVVVGGGDGGDGGGSVCLLNAGSQFASKCFIILSPLRTK